MMVMIDVVLNGVSVSEKKYIIYPHSLPIPAKNYQCMHKKLKVVTTYLKNEWVFHDDTVANASHDALYYNS